LQKGKADKARWLIEETTDEESSEYWTSDDADASHIRKDNNSSAEDENTLKDFFRRNAREERDFAKKAK
jgi:hypothetical protein